MKTPLEQYHHNAQEAGFIHDPAQEKAIQILQNIFDELLAKQKLTAKLQRWLGHRNAVKGLYMWGRVGSGKTYLLNLFYESLPDNLKMRLHFHEFMRHVHQQLTVFQGRQDPLEYVADELSVSSKVICLDEFLVEDIGDAMILGRLLEYLFARGVTIITTSNTKPDDLYKDGLQRQRFLPAITLLKTHCQVIEVNNQIDYRVQEHAKTGHYFTPLNTATAATMQKLFDQYAQQDTHAIDHIMVNDRKLAVLGSTAHVLWVDFETLCMQPRNAEDYLQLASHYAVIFISNIPILGSDLDNAAKRFINAIDVFYDQHRQVIISAAVPATELYQGKLLAEKFKRTVSRLAEI